MLFYFLKHHPSSFRSHALFLTHEVEKGEWEISAVSYRILWLVVICWVLRSSLVVQLLNVIGIKTALPWLVPLSVDSPVIILSRMLRCFVCTRRLTPRCRDGKLKMAPLTTEITNEFYECCPRSFIKSLRYFFFSSDTSEIDFQPFFPSPYR